MALVNKKPLEYAAQAIYETNVGVNVPAFVPVGVDGNIIPGGALADFLYIDDTNTVFIYRDTGSGALSAFTVPAGTAYTIGANPRPWSSPTMATSSLQTAGNTSLSNLDTDLGAPSDAAATTDTGNFGVIAFIKRGLQNWTTLLSRVPTQGQKVSASSSPVVIASDQSNIKVDVQSMPVVAGQATSSLQVTGNTSLASIDTKTPALGQALSSASVPVVLPAAQITTLTPPSTVAVTQATAANLNATVTGTVAATQSGTWNINNISGAVSLPTNAATSALQTTGNTSLSSIDTKTPALVSGKVPVTDPTALPLPTGAATSALQTDGNNSLTTIGFNSSNLLFAFTDLTGILTTTTTSANFRPTAGQAYSVNIDVTAFTGTNRTLDVVIQESDDQGNNWTNIWALPRITTTGSYRTPTIPYRGVLIRYVQTVGGTGVSCTRAINRIELNSYLGSSPSQLFDRTINLNTLDATSAVLNTQNAKYVQIIAATTGGTVAPVLTLECSEDNGVTYYATATSVTGSLTTGIAQSTPSQARNQQLARLRVTTAGVGVTTNYVLIKGF